jgi:Zn-dependent protease with chaperone function
MLSPLFFVLLAVSPGVVAWWTGRRLSRLTDDPVLPELVFARRQRLTVVAATAIAFLLVFGGRAAYWGLPLMALAMLAGNYSSRRAIALETGTFPGYMWRGVKSIAGGFGFWVLLLMTPAIVLAVGARYQLIALVLLAVLFAWEEWYSRIWLWMHDGALLVDETLAPRIDAIVRRAGIAAPTLYKIGGRGTRLVNAFAFPSLRHPSIVFGSALLELLEPDEVAAIYAHELSHIEQYHPRRLRRLQSITRLLILLAVAIPLLMQRFAPNAPRLVLAAWPVIVLATLVVRGRTRKQEETESDLRAAALCGDAEVMARALIKVHVHGLIPRRWSIDFERRASHPSLVRRIQALRGDISTVATPDAPVVLPTAREETVVVFDSARAYWFDGVSADAPRSLDALREVSSSMRSVAWSELVELRVTADGSERALRAVHRNGDKWDVPLDSAHIADVQRALDRIDLRLHRELGTTPRKTPQLLATAAVLAMFLSLEFWPLLVPALLALSRPSTAALGALGVMTTARAGYALTTANDSFLAAFRTGGLIALGLVGLACVGVAVHRVRRQQKRDGTKLTLIVLGTWSAVLAAVALFVVSQASLSELADFPVLPALAVGLLGVAAALLVSATRTTTMAAGATVLAAGITAIGHFSITRHPTTTKLSRLSVDAVEVDRVELAPGFTGLRVSPSGSRFVLQRYDGRVGGRGDPAIRHVVGSFGGSQRDLDVVDVDFIDDEHVVTLRRRDDGIELRLEPVDRDSTIWSAPFPLDDAKLTVASPQHTWTLVGSESTSDSLIVISGTAASPQGTVHRFDDLDSLSAVEQLVFSGGNTLLLPVFNVQRKLSMPLAMFGFYPMRTELWQLSASGRRVVGTMSGFPTCAPPDRERTVCLTRRRNGGSIWMLDSNGSATSLGELGGSDAARVTLGPGLRATFAHSTDRVTEVDAAAARITEVKLPDGPGYLLEARASSGHVIVLRQDGVASRLTRYRVK